MIWSQETVAHRGDATMVDFSQPFALYRAQFLSELKALNGALSWIELLPKDWCVPVPKQVNRYFEMKDGESAIEFTKAFWSAKTGREVSEEDARQMIRTMLDLADILARWNTAQA